MAVLRMFIDVRQCHDGVLLDGPSQQSLVERLRRGEKGALEQVALAHGPRLLRLAHRLLGWSGDAENVVQEVLAKLLAKPERIGGERGLEAWLVAVTVNQCRGHRRVARRFDGLLRKFALLRNETPVLDGVEQGDVNQTVRAAVQRLRAADREVIVLHHLEQVPIVEIAALLGLKVNAVEVRLHRARRQGLFPQRRH
jgi:RNA polymerase sigma-70 factor (ECF subfamily)